MSPKSKTYIKNLTLSAMFLAIGLVLPFFTGQLRDIGNMLLPMHLPVFLCGLICGWQYGAAVGLILPVFRSVLFGMPPLPLAIVMAFELATYGGLSGFLYGHSKWKCVLALYRSMIIAMLGGRVVWAIGRMILAGLSPDRGFSLEIFLTSGFLEAIPGIILQLTLIPVIMVALDRTGMVPFSKRNSAVKEN